MSFALRVNIPSLIPEPAERLSGIQPGFKRFNIYCSEAVEEKISLSEHFGLSLALHPFNQEQYLSIAQNEWPNKFGPTFIPSPSGRGPG